MGELEKFLNSHINEHDRSKEETLNQMEKTLEEWRKSNPPILSAIKQLKVLASQYDYAKEYPENQLFVADFLSRFFSFLENLDGSTLEKVLKKVEDLSPDIKRDIKEAFRKYGMTENKFGYSMLVEAVVGKDSDGNITKKFYQIDSQFPYVDTPILDGIFEKGFFLPSISWVKKDDEGYVLYSVVLGPKSEKWLKFYIAPYINPGIFKGIDVNVIEKGKKDIIAVLNDGTIKRKDDDVLIYPTDEIGRYLDPVKEIISYGEHTYLGLKGKIIVDDKEENIAPIRFNTRSNDRKLIEIRGNEENKVRALEVDDKNTSSRVTVTLEPVVFVERYRRVMRVDSHTSRWSGSFPEFVRGLNISEEHFSASNSPSYRWEEEKYELSYSITQYIKHLIEATKRKISLLRKLEEINKLFEEGKITENEVKDLLEIIKNQCLYYSIDIERISNIKDIHGLKINIENIDREIEKMTNELKRIEELKKVKELGNIKIVFLFVPVDWKLFDFGK